MNLWTKKYNKNQIIQCFTLDWTIRGIVLKHVRNVAESHTFPSYKTHSEYKDLETISIQASKVHYITATGALPVNHHLLPVYRNSALYNSYTSFDYLIQTDKLKKENAAK